MSSDSIDKMKTYSSTVTPEREVICGHLVTGEVKKLWMVELDLADQVKRICEKHGIRYFMGGGTLLGSVRHGGFIPWDDDMDFFLPYADFQKFCEVAPSELEEPYHLSNKFTMSRIRRSDTTGCTKYEWEHMVKDENLGIFVDLFPLTVVPSSHLRRKLHYLHLRLLRLANRGYDRIQTGKFIKKPISFYVSYPWVFLYILMSGFHKDWRNHYLNVCAKYENTDEPWISVTSFLAYRERYIWRRKWFERSIELPFQDRLFAAPKAYDMILKKSFGDYTKFVKGDAQHTMPICDPETPYKETFRKLGYDLS